MQNSRTQIIIASKQFLLRLGIKNLLSFIDIDPELYEVSSLEELHEVYLKMDSSCSIIISNDMINIESSDRFERITDKIPAKQVLLIESSANRSMLRHAEIVNMGQQQGEIVKKFQDFFAEPKEEEEYNFNAILSNREIDVLKSVATGLSNKQIADKLCISINTVVTHRKNITEKLEIKTISGLTVYALLNGMIVADDVSKI